MNADEKKYIMKREPTFVFKSAQIAVTVRAGLNATESRERNIALRINPARAIVTSWHGCRSLG